MARRRQAVKAKEPEPLIVESKPQPAKPEEIRDAIASLIPSDPNLVSDIKVHDGVADIAVKWRSLRWSTCQAVQTRDPDEIAVTIDAEFRAWLRNTINVNAEQPRHGRIIAEIRQWLKQNPDKNQWLYGT